MTVSSLDASGMVGAVDGLRARRRLTVTGVVQGVGFRPFVHRLAIELALDGFVGNDSTGVFIEIEGDPPALDRFAERLVAERPPLARIDWVAAAACDVTHRSGFEIVESAAGDGPRTLVPPDVATCDECLDDVADPDDRRYRYPFTNCTNCGPRFTIIRDLPYDRPATTMAAFEMCADCAAEYHDPTDRRYHAQPIACPSCGPQLTYRSRGQVRRGTDEVIAAVQSDLAGDRVVAIKGLGGYHLACDAGSDSAVELLRARKGRVDKPFAVMVADLAAAHEVAELTDADEAALTSAARPIVLVRRRDAGPLAAGVAPGNPLVGLMLPYTALHHLLFAAAPGSDVPPPPRLLVMTSGNRSNEPICFRDDDARERLADLADAFCTHDRPIEVPCDDSVVRVIDGVVQPVRRSRGYAPVPVALPVEVPPVLGVGAELKNTCCLASGRHAWVGQHVGDMENLETLDAFEASVDAFSRMYDVTPTARGADLHPDYLTRRWAIERDPVSVVGVQHHHAHVASVMVEHGLDGTTPVLGFAFDGTGYGVAADGTIQIWGGEVLLADYDGFRRVGHLAPLPLPGGDGAVRNPCRIAVAYLEALGLPLDERLPSVVACDEIELGVVRRQVERDLGCVPTTSMGRLFDAVASLLGVRHRVSYEAQAAIELEALAERCADAAPDDLAAFELTVVEPDGVVTLDPRPVVAALAEGVLAGRDRAGLARAFHDRVTDAIVDLAIGLSARHRLSGPVALTGGVFQNALLARTARERLAVAGIDVISHHVVPPNDGGLSLGQAVIAGRAVRDLARDRTGKE